MRKETANEKITVQRNKTNYFV